MLPRNVYRHDVARALSISERTISNLLEKSYAETRTVSLGKIAKVLSADPAWVWDCVEGRDFAVSELHANASLGGTGHVLPRARLKHGRRYSARDLGLFRDPVVMPPVALTGPLAGTPDSNVLGPRGWEQSS